MTPAPDAVDDLSTPDGSAAEDPGADQATADRRGRWVAAAVMVTLLGGLLVVQAGEDPPAVPAGFSSRGDGARSGVVSTVPVSPPNDVVWRVPVDVGPLLGEEVGVLAVTPLEQGEVAVVLDPTPTGPHVAVHDAEDGRLRWTTMLPLGGGRADTSVSGHLLAHRTVERLTLLDLAAEERRWTVELRLEQDTQVTRHGIVGVVAGGAQPEVVLLAVEDATERWRYVHDRDATVTRVHDTGDVVLLELSAGAARSLVALDPASGRVRWRTDDGPVVGEPGTTVVTTGGPWALVAGTDRAVLVDLGDGSTRQVTATDGVAPTGALVADDGSTVLASERRVEAWAPDGSLRWSVSDLGGRVRGLQQAAGVVVVSTADDQVVLDGTSGAVLGRAGGPATGAPVGVSRDGGVLGVRDGVLARADLVGGPSWSVPTVVVHPPELATDAGRVAVTTPSGIQVHAVQDGEEAWSYAAFVADLVRAGDLTAPALRGTRVAVAPPASQSAGVGGLLGLFAETGILEWARQDDRVPPRGTPVLDGELLWLPVGSQVLGFDRGNGVRRAVVETSIARTDVAVRGDWIAAVDGPLDGGDLWVGQRSTGRMVYRAPIRTCTPPLLHGELVIVGTHTGDIIARELATGEQPWGERSGGAACRGLAVAGDQLVTLVDDRELLFVGLDDGETTARIELPATAAGAPVVAGDEVLVATLDGRVSAWHVSSDAPLWSVLVDGVPFGAVAVDGDTVLVRTRAGELLALR